MLASADAKLGGAPWSQAVPIEGPGGRGKKNLPDRAARFPPAGFDVPRPRHPHDASVLRERRRLLAQGEAAPHGSAAVTRKQARMMNRKPAPAKLGGIEDERVACSVMQSAYHLESSKPDIRCQAPAEASTIDPSNIG